MGKWGGRPYRRRKHSPRPNSPAAASTNPEGSGTVCRPVRYRAFPSWITLKSIGMVNFSRATAAYLAPSVLVKMPSSWPPGWATPATAACVTPWPGSSRAEKASWTWPSSLRAVSRMTKVALTPPLAPVVGGVPDDVAKAPSAYQTTSRGHPSVRRLVCRLCLQFAGTGRRRQAVVLCLAVCGCYRVSDSHGEEGSFAICDDGVWSRCRYWLLLRRHLVRLLLRWWWPGVGCFLRVPGRYARCDSRRASSGSLPLASEGVGGQKTAVSSVRWERAVGTVSAR